MSGGSLDYAYARVEDAASTIRSRAKNVLHVAFAEHLDLVATALRDAEWVLSGDKIQGEDSVSILTCIRAESVLEVALKRAEVAKNELDEAIRLVRNLDGAE